MRGRTIFTSISTAVVLACGLGAVASATPIVAMNGHMPSDADLAAIEAVGAEAVRMDFNWLQFNPASGTYDWADLDAAVASAHAHHLAVYATIAYTPAWASSVPACVPSSSDDTMSCNNKLPAQVSDWTTAVTQVVTRFAGQIDCWGIWNEPNLRTFFDGTEDQFVTQIFMPAATAIRAADPAGRICGPELSGLTASSNWSGTKGTCIAGNCIRNGWEIDLADMLDRVGSQLDVVTQHMYESDAPGVMVALLDGTYFGTLLTHDAVHNVVTAHGAGDKEFWLTETGWNIDPTNQASLDAAATNIVALYTSQDQICAGTYAASTNDPWRHWSRTYFYDFQNIVGAGDAPLSPYTALETWTAAHAQTACGSGSPTVDGPHDASVTTGGNDGSTNGETMTMTPGGCGCHSGGGAGDSSVMLGVGVVIVWLRRNRRRTSR